MQIRHYYHIYAGGAWAAPVRDHFTALGRAGLDDMTFTVGLVGPEQDRKMAREMVTLRCEKWVLPKPVTYLEADEGFEQLTLRKIHRDVQEIPGEFAVLYAHTKGAYNDTDANASWRRAMTAKVVGGWEDCVDTLATFDAVGCHWMQEDDNWFFAGNFWWARASHLRRLPPPDSIRQPRQPAVDRFTAELWVSLPACPERRGDMGTMSVHSLIDGRPEYGDL